MANEIGDTKNDYVTKFFNAIGILSDVQLDLRTMSRAFEITGNTSMASDLKALELSIEEAKGMAKSAVSEQLHSGFEQANNDIGMVLTAILAKEPEHD